MPIISRISRETESVEIDLLSNGYVIDEIINKSENQSGHNMEIIFSDQEWRILFRHFPKMMRLRICELFFFDLLKKLRKIHGSQYPGFHWEMTSDHKGFRTFNYGLF